LARTTAVPPSQLTDRLYYDTAVFSTTLLRRLIEDVGVEHVLLGTDRPFELGDRNPVDTVHSLGLDRQGARAILWDNAAALLAGVSGLSREREMFAHVSGVVLEPGVYYLTQRWGA